MPLVSPEHSRAPPYAKLNNNDAASEDDDSVLDVTDEEKKKTKAWYNYLPLLLLITLIFAPQYSVLLVYTSYYLKSHSAPITFSILILVTYGLIFLACSSLIVCIARDPGAVRANNDEVSRSGNYSELSMQDERDGRSGASTSVAEALITPVVVNTEGDDFNAPHKWCRKCWAPKPERTHHCSICGRCVLKMDHHCPWLAQKCVGHWIYPSFLHFLLSVTLLASFVCIICSRIVYNAFVDPFLVSERTAIHALILSLYTAVMALTVGSFFLYHVYLVSTNQTTLESLSPFLLLRYLPAVLPPNETPHDSPGNIEHSNNDDSTSSDNPYGTRNRTGLAQLPQEHQLSSAQRRHVRYAHGHLRLYDIGFRKNWDQVVGVGEFGYRAWLFRAICGGSRSGCCDGTYFPRNPKSDAMLSRLAQELLEADKID